MFKVINKDIQILWPPEFHCHICYSPSQLHNLSHMISVYTSLLYLFNIDFMFMC